MVNLVSAGDTDFSPPTAAVQFLLQFLPLPEIRLEAGDSLLFFKPSSFPSSVWRNEYFVKTAGVSLACTLSGIVYPAMAVHSPFSRILTDTVFASFFANLAFLSDT